MMGGAWGALMSATAAALISLVFARSVLHQIGDVDSFIGSVAAYELLPQAAVAAVSRSLIAAEIVLMIAVLVPATRIVGASLAIVMLLGVRRRHGREYRSGPR